MPYFVCSRDGSVEFTRHERETAAWEFAALTAKRKNTPQANVTVVQAGDSTEAADKAAEYFRKN